MKRKIKKEFLLLLKEKPIHKISVKNICDNLNINRSTFYYYFIDIYDVFEQIEKDWTNHFLTLIQSSKNLSLENIFKIILKDISQNKNQYTTFFSRKEQHFSPNIIEICYEYYKQNTTQPITKETRWSFYFAIKGCNEIIRLWQEDGMKEDIDEVSQYLVKQFYKTMKI